MTPRDGKWRGNGVIDDVEDGMCGHGISLGVHQCNRICGSPSRSEVIRRKMSDHGIYANPKFSDRNGNYQHFRLKLGAFFSHRPASNSTRYVLSNPRSAGWTGSGCPLCDFHTFGTQNGVG